MVPVSDHFKNGQGQPREVLMHACSHSFRIAAGELDGRTTLRDAAEFLLPGGTTISHCRVSFRLLLRWWTVHHSGCTSTTKYGRRNSN